MSKSATKKTFYKSASKTFAVLESLSPHAASRIAGMLFSKPIPHKIKQEDEEFLQSAAKLKVPTRFGEVRGWRWGSGPAVLLVHGWSGRASQFREFVKALNAAGYSAIAFDQPGHGDSSGKLSTLIRFNEALSQVNRWYGPFTAVVAHSLGALSVAVVSKEQFIAPQKILISPVPGIEHAVEYFIDAVGVTERLADRMMKGYENHYGVDFSQFEFHRLAKDLSGDILVIHDESDKLVSWKKTARWAEVNENIRFEMTKGLGHQRILSSKATIDRVTSFIEETPSIVHADVRQLMFSEYAL